MDDYDYKLNHPTSPTVVNSPHSPPLHGICFQTLSSRLSKVTEENSHNQNNSAYTKSHSYSSSSDNDNDNENDPYYEYECDPYGLPLSNPNSALFNPGAPIHHNRSNHLHHHQQQHHNTPYHENSDPEDTNFIFDAFHHDSTPNDLIPDRLRLLLDRFAANGYILSNAPPPANKSFIDSIPERIVDKNFICTHKQSQSQNLENAKDCALECSICRMNICENQCIKTLKCSHFFHSRCIVTWLHIHASCPLCRCQLIETNANEQNMEDADAQTRSYLNRLQDLRRRRRNRRTLRSSQSQTSTNSNSGTQTPLNQYAATQLIHAVADILNQYTSNPLNNSTQRIVRFCDEKRTNKLLTSPHLKSSVTPHSSRSNTKHQMSLPDLPLSLSPLSPIHHNGHLHNHSSPTIYGEDLCELNEMNDIALDNDDCDEKEQPISASKIKQDFSNWINQKRLSRLNLDAMSEGNVDTTKKSKKKINANLLFLNDNDASTPSPKLQSNAQQNVLPTSHAVLCSDFSNQTMVERNVPFSGLTSPNISIPEENVCDDYNDSVYALMSDEQLENAYLRSKEIMNKQRNLLEVIEKEKKKRQQKDDFEQWKCFECGINASAYLFLPCRHLGLCKKCQKDHHQQVIKKCFVCNQNVRQQVAINFD